jgi:hypothetical protein
MLSYVFQCSCITIDFSGSEQLIVTYNANVQTLHTHYHCPNYDR